MKILSSKSQLEVMNSLLYIQRTIDNLMINCIDDNKMKSPELVHTFDKVNNKIEFIADILLGDEGLLLLDKEYSRSYENLENNQKPRQEYASKINESLGILGQ